MSSIGLSKIVSFRTQYTSGTQCLHTHAPRNLLSKFCLHTNVMYTLDSIGNT